MEAMQMPGSRYRYFDFGLCIFVDDGLHKSGLGVTHGQAFTLSRLRDDLARDALFHPWMQETRERDPRYRLAQDQIREARRYRLVYGVVAVAALAVAGAFPLAFDRSWRSMLPLALVFVLEGVLAYVSHRRIRRYRAVLVSILPVRN